MAATAVGAVACGSKSEKCEAAAEDSVACEANCETKETPKKEGGKKSNVKLKTEADTLAYAIGLDMGRQFFNNVDSTINIKTVSKALTAVFEGNPQIEYAEAKTFLETYFNVTLPKRLSDENIAKSAKMMAEAAKMEGAKVSESGLIYIIEDEGAEHKIQDGDQVAIHYALYNPDGELLQSSKDLGRPMRYKVTPTAMIEGFTEGVAMLGEGGVATLYLPSEIAYGTKGGGTIGPDMALRFDVEVVSVEAGE